jgi:hypothetical protein
MTDDEVWKFLQKHMRWDYENMACMKVCEIVEDGLIDKENAALFLNRAGWGLRECIRDYLDYYVAEFNEELKQEEEEEEREKRCAAEATRVAAQLAWAPAPAKPTPVPDDLRKLEEEGC